MEWITDGVCLTRATSTSSSPIILQRNVSTAKRAASTTMRNDEGISLFLNFYEFPLFFCGMSQIYASLFVIFSELGEAEQNCYLRRQNVESNCNCNWKSQDVYGHLISLAWDYNDVSQYKKYTYVAILQRHTFRAWRRSHSSKKPQCAAESTADRLLSGTVHEVPSGPTLRLMTR